MEHYSRHYSFADRLTTDNSFMQNCRQLFELPPLSKNEAARLKAVTIALAELLDFMELAIDCPQMADVNEVKKKMHGVALCQPLLERMRGPFQAIDKLAVTLKPDYHQLKLELEEGYGCDYAVWKLIGEAWLSRSSTPHVAPS